MKKCPKCKQMKLESTTGGLTHMVWYQVYKCINCNIKVEKEYQLDKPLGVRGRSSNNDLVREKLNWDIETKLKDGLEKTYKWIYDEITSGKNNDKFSKSSY